MKISSLRFVYNNDKVTNRMGYKHVGKLIRFDSKSMLFTDCGIKADDVDKLGDDNEECHNVDSKDKSGDHYGWFFKTEKLIPGNKYCNMKVNQVEDAVY